MVRSSYRMPSAMQALPVHSAYFLAAGSVLARRPTRRGDSIPDCLSLATWERTSSRKGAAMVPASTFLAPGAYCFGGLAADMGWVCDERWQ